MHKLIWPSWTNFTLKLSQSLWKTSPGKGSDDNWVYVFTEKPLSHAFYPPLERNSTVVKTTQPSHPTAPYTYTETSVTSPCLEPLKLLSRTSGLAGSSSMHSLNTEEIPGIVLFAGDTAINSACSSAGPRVRSIAAGLERAARVGSIRYMLYYRYSLKTLCWVKEGNHERPHILIPCTWTLQNRQIRRGRKQVTSW